MKIIFYCSQCEADYNIKHDLEEPYIIQYCPFCGEQIDEENTDEIEDEDPIS